MLKTLIAKLAKTLFHPQYNPGYQTRVYPRLGEMIIVHDTLDFGPIATADELKPINDIWLSDEAFAFDSFPSINPANGLQMMDGLLDIAGNVYGMNDCGTDCTHTSFETDTPF